MTASHDTHVQNDPQSPERPARRKAWMLLASAFLVAVVATLVVTFVLVTMFERKQEARTPFVRAVEVSELSTDSQPWGANWPHHFDGWRSTAGDTFYGGSSALPASKLEKYPWLKRLYAGYAFSIDYREARGHAYMLYDQGVTERVTQKPQAGACLHCHTSISVLYRKVGLEAMGQPADEAALAADFNMPAVIRGFEELSTRPYFEVMQLLRSVPDGTPERGEGVFPMPPDGGFSGTIAGQPLAPEQVAGGAAHPVGCIDCHHPETLALRVTRPGFMLGIAALAAGDAPVPHLPSVERWRQGERERPYDPNRDASRQEMRSFACAQCHVEYYCAAKQTLTFPWGRGLRAEDLERFWEEETFPDGAPFFDFMHGETGAPVFKVQHPEFELWSQGIHARSGVSCADCHMPYERRGAMKLSNHDIASPLRRLNSACQQCHSSDAIELEARIATTQERTLAAMERAARAMTDMLDAILQAKAAGVGEDRLQEVYLLQRKAMWRLDYISSENSRGFHADQEAMRLLAESIDYSRQAQVAATRLRAPAPPSVAGLPVQPVQGVSTGKASTM
jgi:nitrite reductase (cytochrome c-552)